MKRKPARRKNKRILNRSQKKYFFRIGVFVLLFSISLIFLFMYTFEKYLNQNFVSALSTSSYSILDDNIPTVSYIVVEDLSVRPTVIKKVNYIIFDKLNQKASIYNIPLYVNYEISGRFGNEEFSKLFALGAMNAKDPLKAGTELINRSIFKLFGFKVDKYVLTDVSQEEFFDRMWREGGHINIFNLKNVTNFENSLKTDLSLAELNSLLTFLDSLPSDRIMDNAITPQCFCDTESFDNKIKEETIESAIAKENKNIAILNGTDYNGLASFGARVVKNIGGRIVAVGNTEKQYNTSVVIADDPDSKTAAFLSRVFMIPQVISKTESYSFMENEIDRSDVVVIFGFDTSGDLY